MVSTVNAPRILVVDDSADMLGMLTLAFRMRGYEVVGAACAEAALEQLTTLTPDLVVTDYCMHGMDGVRLCEEIRATAAHADVPIVLFSSAERNADITRALALGGVHHRLKTVGIHALLALAAQLAGTPDARAREAAASA